METNFFQVATTTANKDDAEKLARMMVDKGLAACAQVEGPMTSFYWWQGKVENDQEWKCSFKTSKERYQELEDEIRMSHPYDTPEIIVLPVIGGSEEYLTWLKTELRPG